MQIACQADDSHEMSRIVFSEKKKKILSSAAVVIGALKLKVDTGATFPTTLQKIPLYLP